MSQTLNDDVPELSPTAQQDDAEAVALTMPVGFVGLGAMGLKMAAALVRAGHSVLACDIDMARLSMAVDECGDAIHTTPIAAELGTRCELVFLMLPGSFEVAQVTGDLAATMAPGGRMVDLGHTDPAETRTLAASLAAHVLRLIDAPAVGGPQEAAAATLEFLIGGGEADLAAVEPYLKAMGGMLTHTGDVGSAHEAVRRRAG
jgi:3-hydroxyisobutyrate dehydrogenase